MTVPAQTMLDEMPAESRKRIEIRAAKLIAACQNSTDPRETGLRPDEAPPPDRPRNTA